MPTNHKKPPKINLLYVTNKNLPSGDYRLEYRKVTRICNVRYGLPEKPKSIKEEDYTRVGFGERFRFVDIYCYMQLFSYLVAHRTSIDYVHFFSTQLIIIGPFIARIAKVPSIITITGFGRIFSRDGFKYKVMRPIYLVLLRISSHISKRTLFQNHGDMKWFAKKSKTSPSKFIYVGSAIKKKIVRKKPFAGENVRVLLVSRIFPDKGISDFIQVAKNLNNRDFEFVLIGPKAPGFSHLYEQVIKNNRDGIIQYLGELSSSKTYKQFARADIFFFPSSYGEGMPRVMLESGFAQLCPIAYDIPSNRDLISEGGGFLVEAGNTNEVIRILKYLHHDRNNLAKNAIAYQAHVLANFNIEEYSKNMDKIIVELFGMDCLGK